MRDALSLLDQAVSFSDEELSVNDALLITRSLSQHYIGKLASALHHKQVSEALETLNELLQQRK